MRRGPPGAPRDGITSGLVENAADIMSADPPREEGLEIEIPSADPATSASSVANSPSPRRATRSSLSEIGGKRYSHIVDREDRIGLTDRIAVTVAGHRALSPTGWRRRQREGGETGQGTRGHLSGGMALHPPVALEECRESGLRLSFDAANQAVLSPSSVLSSRGISVFHCGMYFLQEHETGWFALVSVLSAGVLIGARTALGRWFLLHRTAMTVRA